MSQKQKASFDPAAESYDTDFTLSEIGIKQRERVFYWLKRGKVLTNVKNIFEVNCGTGYDAEYFHKQGYRVISTDASSEMITVAKSKRAKEIDFYTLHFNNIAIDDNVGKSDFVFSNFGGLNCLNKEELKKFFNDLALKQKPGSKLAVIIMPERCMVEDVYFLLKGKLSKIGRRSRNAYLDVDVNGEKVKTFYHSPKVVKQLLCNNYNISLVKPIAHFLPPSYLEPFFKKNKWLLSYLNFMERIFGWLGFLASNADHFILIAERK